MTEQQMTPEQKLQIEEYLRTWSRRMMAGIGGVLSLLGIMGYFSITASTDAIAHALVQDEIRFFKDEKMPTIRAQLDSQIVYAQNKIVQLDKLALEGLRNLTAQSARAERDAEMVNELAEKYKTHYQRSDEKLTDLVRQTEARRAELEKAIDQTSDSFKVIESKWSGVKKYVEQMRTEKLQTEIVDELLRRRTFTNSVGQALKPMPVGAVAAFVGTTPPDNWMLCDGSVLRSKRYPSLFAAIGTAHGGDTEQGHFNLPDFRGLFLRGVDHGAGRDPHRQSRNAPNPGGHAGDLVGSVQDDATKMPDSRFVTARAGRHAHVKNPDGDTPYDRLLKFSGRGTVVVTDSRFKKGREEPYLANSQAMVEAGEHTHRIEGGDLESRPKNAYVDWIIRVR